MAVEILVGAVNLGLQPLGVEQDVGFEAGQSALNVVGAKVLIACHADAGEFPFNYFDPDNSISQPLLRQRDTDGGET